MTVNNWSFYKREAGSFHTRVSFIGVRGREDKLYKTEILLRE